MITDEPTAPVGGENEVIVGATAGVTTCEAERAGAVAVGVHHDELCRWGGGRRHVWC